MRIMSLSEMLTELRFEARISGDTSHGSHLVPQHVALLRRIQEELYDAWDWPALQQASTTVVAGGQRYAALPCPHNGIVRVHVKRAGQYVPLTYGIGVEQLNAFDSDEDARDDYVRNWQAYQSPQAEQPAFNMFEVWPIPRAETRLRFLAKRALAPLNDPNVDHSTLDGPLIVLHAAAEILAAQKAEDTPLKLQKATERFGNIKETQASGDTRSVSMLPRAGRARTSRFNI
jgi:hypothetical protein